MTACEKIIIICNRLETLEDSLYSDLDYKRPSEFVNPSELFPFEEPWNMKFEGYANDKAAYGKYKNEYFSVKWETEMLRICNYGCGVSLNSVVNGQEKDNIWVDEAMTVVYTPTHISGKLEERIFSTGIYCGYNCH